MLSIWWLILGAAAVLANHIPITCPPGFIPQTQFTNFTISTNPTNLFNHIGDFFSPTWTNLLSLDTLTISPPHRTLTKGPLTLTESLLSNGTSPSAFYINFGLTSGTFSPAPTVRIVSYEQTISALKIVCAHTVYSAVTWATASCVSGEVGVALEWFSDAQRRIAARLFTSISGGWISDVPGDTVVEDGCLLGFGIEGDGVEEGAVEEVEGGVLGNETDAAVNGMDSVNGTDVVEGGGWTEEDEDFREATSWNDSGASRGVDVAVLLGMMFGVLIVVTA